MIMKFFYSALLLLLLSAGGTAAWLAVSYPMPLNMAMLGWSKADDVIAEHPGVKHWFLAGHSLGGLAAARYAEKQADKLSGLILWAAHTADDLSSLQLPVLSLYALGDQSTTVSAIDDHRTLLTGKYPVRRYRGQPLAVRAL